MILILQDSIHSVLLGHYKSKIILMAFIFLEDTLKGQSFHWDVYCELKWGKEELRPKRAPEWERWPSFNR